MLRLGLLPVTLLALLLLPMGCGGDDGGGDELERPTSERPEEEVEQVEEVVEEGAGVDRYSYNAVGKRDPFRSFISRVV